MKKEKSDYRLLIEFLDKGMSGDTVYCSQNFLKWLVNTDKSEFPIQQNRTFIREERINDGFFCFFHNNNLFNGRVIGLDTIKKYNDFYDSLPFSGIAVESQNGDIDILPNTK